MYNSIEITDSDEETAAAETTQSTEMPAERVQTPPTTKMAAVSACEANERTPEKQTPTQPAKGTTAASTNTTQSSPSTSDATNSPSTTCSATINANPGKQAKRSRKTQHQTLRISPTDIQFETIALDEDAEDASAAKQAKLTPPPPETDPIKAAIASMLDTPEMQKIVKHIAEERVRCNFLLATYQLPDMNFSLNTPIDMLKNQFRDRLKQRRERVAASNANATPNVAAPTTSAANSNPAPSAVPPLAARTKLS